MAKVAIVGASGVVGRTVLDILGERNIKADFFLFASKNSDGKVLNIGDKEYVVKVLDDNIFSLGLDYALMCTREDVSKKYVKRLAEQGTVVIDFSSYFRKKYPLVVPQINSEDILGNIICNPNCATIGEVMSLFAIHKKYGLKSIYISTYQSLSGAGKLALDDKFVVDERQLKKLDYVINNNIIPYIGTIYEDNFCEEERKIIFETKKILHDEDIFIMSQTVRVPIDVCHGESIFFETKVDCDVESLKHEIENSKNVRYVPCAMPILTKDKDDVLVSRLRQYDKRHFAMFVVVDNLRKGAAQNGVEILIELLGGRYGRCDNGASHSI